MEKSRTKRGFGPDQPESNPERLLAGEDPETILPRDAIHWIAIYREMINFKIQVLNRVGEGLRGVSDEAKTELSEDVDLIEAQLGRYERRLKFWLKRVDTLTPNNGRPRSRKA
jgi:hypothetical protein